MSGGGIWRVDLGRQVGEGARMQFVGTVIERHRSVAKVLIATRVNWQRLVSAAKAAPTCDGRQVAGVEPDDTTRRFNRGGMKDMRERRIS